MNSKTMNLGIYLINRYGQDIIRNYDLFRYVIHGLITIGWEAKYIEQDYGPDFVLILHEDENPDREFGDDVSKLISKFIISEYS